MFIVMIKASIHNCQLIFMNMEVQYVNNLLKTFVNHELSVCSLNLSVLSSGNATYYIV